jgi:zinc transporter 7
MKYAISFAIGGLLGDVFFHTMPHMNSGGGHGHSHDHGHDNKTQGEHAGHDHHGHDHHGHDHGNAED